MRRSLGLVRQQGTLCVADGLQLLQKLRILPPPARVETPGPKTTRQSLAVLPFYALDRDEETEFIADGLTDELITSLSQVTSLRVVAHASSFHFKGRDLDGRQLRRKLRVDTVLTGHVRRSDTVLRVSAQLIDTADGCHLWARRFEGTTSAYFELEDELTKAITMGTCVSRTRLRSTRGVRRCAHRARIPHPIDGLRARAGGGPECGETATSWYDVR